MEDWQSIYKRVQKERRENGWDELFESSIQEAVAEIRNPWYDIPIWGTTDEMKKNDIKSELKRLQIKCYGTKCAALFRSAPALLAALEDIVKNACRMCESELKVAMHGTKKPCEDGRPCPRGMDDARKAIAKSYWKKEQKTDEND